MSVQVEPALLVAFLLALARAGAWLTIAPPFNSRVIPIPVKVGVSAALALSVAPRLSTALGNSSFDTAGLISAMAIQVAAGVALGFIGVVLFSAISAGGSFIDMFGGFRVSAAYDPLLLDQTSVFGRFYNLLAVTLLFAIDGHLILVKGFLTSFTALPLQGLSLNHLGAILTQDIGIFFLSALEIAAPLLAALFLAQVVLGLLSRAAPTLNVFAMSFPFTILLTLLLAGFALPVLPQAVSSLVQHIVQGGAALR